MTSERWLKVKEIFHLALEQEPAQRSGFLADACAGDESMREEVESLISSHEKDGSFIDCPAYEVAATVLTSPDELSAGQRFGRFEILSTLGRGGMGEVYLAKDSRLGRNVALKFLCRSFMNDPDRLRRFEQEARAASALNQPSILTIHEIGEADGRSFIATEYIEGETLRQRLRHTPLTIAEALEIARQVAAALAVAHAAGIIHRDIKPENIMLRSDGLVKVLDFGLAKLSHPEIGPEDLTQSFVKTSAGMVMGTVAYMSPEQARGLSVDARTDIWSLGVTLYEMLAGSPPFTGATNSDVLVAVLEHAPPSLSLAISDVSRLLDALVMKSLTKDLDKRYQSANEILNDTRDIQRALNSASEPERASSSTRRQASDLVVRRTNEVLSETKSLSPSQAKSPILLRSPWLLATIAFVGLAVVVANYFLLWQAPERGTTIAAPPEVLRTTQIPTRTGMEVPALSSDGNSIAYHSPAGSGSNEIFVKPLTPGARDIQITSDAQNSRDPAWSPDGKLIAYQSTKKGGLWLIPSTGGTARQLADFGSFPSWSPDGSMIAFQSDATDMPPTTIWTIPTAGGKAAQLTKQGSPTGGHGTPSWSPDGKRIAFVAYWGSSRGQLWTINRTGDDLKRLSKKAIWFSHPVYTPDGHWIFASGVSETGSFGLYRVNVSPATGEALSEPEEVSNTGLARISGRLTIAAHGKKLAYAARTLTGDLISVPVSTSGNPTGPPKSLVESTSYRKGGPLFSPDGTKLAFIDFRAGENQKIWVIGAEDSKLVPLTTGPQMDWSASWFPDNDTVAFLRDELGHQSVHAVSVSTGKDKLLFAAPRDMGWPRLSPDAKQIAFNSAQPLTINIWTIPVEGGEPRQLTFDTEAIGWPCWSPDGKLLAIGIKRGADQNLGIMSSGGGEVTQLIFEPGQSWANDWSPDGDKILFAGQRKGIWNVYWYSLSTKSEKQLTHYTSSNHYVRYPTWSPLRNQIVFEYGESTGSVWLMELK